MSVGPEDASPSDISAALAASDAAPPEASAPSEETPAVEPAAVEPAEPVELPPAVEPEEEPPGDEPGTEEAASEATPDDGDFRAHMHDTYGLKVSEFKSDSALAASLAEATRLIGRRDESAELGKVAQSLGLDARQMANLVQGQQQPAPPQVEEKPPLTFDQMLLMREAVIDPATNTLREGADPAKIAQLRQYQEDDARWRHEMRHNPAGLLKDVTAEITQKVETQTQAQSQQQRVEQQFVNRAQTFEQANQSWLYKGGKPTQHADGKAHPEDFTPDGLAFWKEAAVLGERYAIHDTHGAVIGNKLDPMDLAEQALENFQLRQAAARNPIRTAKPAATHRAEPAADTPSKLAVAKPPADMEAVQALAFTLRATDEASRANAGELK